MQNSLLALLALFLGKLNLTGVELGSALLLRLCCISMDYSLKAARSK